MMIKLIVTDVDDTVVPEGESVINPEYYEVIRECRKKRDSNRSGKRQAEALCKEAV